MRLWGQVAVFVMLALTLGKEKKMIDEHEYKDIIAELKSIPDKMELVLKTNDEIEELAKQFTYAHNFILS